jgi:DNA-binding NtrC family response regulator
VLLLARGFLAESCRRYGRPGLALGEAAEAALLAHAWPGNVRELRQVIEQAVLLAVGERIGPADLNMREVPRLSAAARPGEAPGTTLGETERELIVQALRRAGGNVTVAAAELGISRDTLRYRMERHGLKRSTFT